MVYSKITFVSCVVIKMKIKFEKHEKKFHKIQEARAAPFLDFSNFLIKRSGVSRSALQLSSIDLPFFSELAGSLITVQFRTVH